MDSLAFIKFGQLCRAVHGRRIALLECIGSTDEPDVALICEVRRIANGLVEFIPLAHMPQQPLDALLLPVASTLDDLSAQAN